MNPSTGPDEMPSVPPALDIVALDDDADFRQFLAGMLTAEGHTLRAAATPEECFGLCEASMPDVLLLDMNMGRHNGSTVLLEARKRWPKLCIIIITGYPTMESMRATFKQDAFDYLSKPFSMEELRRVLAHAAFTLNLGQRPQDRLRFELGRQIRLARTQKPWTLKDLCDASGVSISQLSSIERGAHLPSLESLVAIAHALDQQPSSWLASAGF